METNEKMVKRLLKKIFAQSEPIREVDAKKLQILVQSLVV